jgi:uncharacterized protein (TIGR02646 family)
VRFILLAHPPNLPRRWNNVYIGRRDGLTALTTGVQRSDYLNKKPSWNLLKKWLASMSAEKCWYCESHSIRSPFDVDHFRPKLAITVDGTPLAGHSGYYWLAYEWWNFRLSCQRCNRPEKDESDNLHGKANEFPILDEATRCTTPAGVLNSESPRFLDPCVEGDCSLLAHSIDGEVKPVASNGTWDNLRARYTIDRFGLNNWNTPESKRSKWQPIAVLLTIVGSNPAHVSPAVTDELNKHLSNDHEYSSFFRAAIGTHRDKPWVESLL